MATPHLVDPIKAIDPVDALRLLVADLQALADRLGLKEQSRSLQQTMKATQERVFGPRTVIMLLAEDEVAKRHFLERLLGPDLARVPPPTTGCLRLEHGAEAECTVTMPQGLSAVMPLEQLPQFLERRGAEMPAHSMQTVRLPNATLARGLAVLDTPPLRDEEPSQWLLERADEADAWVVVLGADHAVTEPTLNLLCALPRPATRLEIVVEGAETLSGEERHEARQNLLNTLAQTCNLLEPRLTLLASARAEGEGGSFWHGRFATFQSGTLARGKEHRLRMTRSVVAEALSEVAEEIEFELKSTSMGIRQARLRLGQKDLESLRMRFDELGLLAAQPRPAPSLVSAVIWPEEKSARPAQAPAPARAAHQGPVLPVPAVAVPAKAPVQAAPAPVHPATRRRAAVYSEAAKALAAAAESSAPSTPASVAQPTDSPAMHSRHTPALSGREWSEPRHPEQQPWGTGDEPGHHASAADQLDDFRRQVTFVPFQQGGSMPSPRRPALSAGLHDRLERALMLVSVLFPPPSPARRERVMTMRWRLAGFALVGAVVWLVLWAVWPHDHVYSPEPAAQWVPDEGTQTSNSGRTTAGLAAGPAAGASSRRGRRGPEIIAEPSYSGLNLGDDTVKAAPREPQDSQTSSAEAPAPKPSAAKTFLPSDSGTDSSAAPARHKKRNGFLGLKRAWHWVHHDDAAQDTTPNDGVRTSRQAQPNN